MSQSRLRIVLATVCLLAAASPASAQFWPGGYGSGGWGGYPYGQYKFAQQQALVAQNRQLGQMAAMGQNMVVQSGIRNTLTSQAQAQTSAIQSQQQATQDWWFQTQQQQTAQRQAREAQQPLGFGVPLGTAGAGLAVASAPRTDVATDIIKWLPLLQDPRFADGRAKIESPYRRNPPGLSTPTADDYREMVKTVEQMKLTLQDMTGEISAKDYLQAETFLSKMGQEAATRAEPSGAAPKPQ